MTAVAPAASVTITLPGASALPAVTTTVQGGATTVPGGGTFTITIPAEPIITTIATPSTRIDLVTAIDSSTTMLSASTTIFSSTAILTLPGVPTTSTSISGSLTVVYVKTALNIPTAYVFLSFFLTRLFLSIIKKKKN